LLARVQVTEGPDAGKLALLDFGLVAEIPPQDRAAMVSATIHLVSHAGALDVDGLPWCTLLDAGSKRSAYQARGLVCFAWYSRSYFFISKRGLAVATATYVHFTRLFPAPMPTVSCIFRNPHQPHQANRNWAALIDDFIDLEFLPKDANRAVIVPVMERVLGPYLRGGGAKAFNFQALSQDLLTTTLEIPFR
jgi:hypothetical protein